jgi:predicted RNase H-like HicB family nuclease
MESQGYITLILEKTDEEYWVSVKELTGCYSSGSTIDEAIENIKIAISDHVNDLPGGTIVPEMFFDDNKTFKIQYDLESLFEKFNFLNKTAIAEKAGINPSLVRQYSSGLANASEKQKIKIINAIHEIANDLLAVSI